MKISMCCRICGNTKGNKLYEIRERQINNGDVFQYLHCNQCGTLQLNDKIENTGDFYKEYYYSFHLKSAERKIPPFLMKGCMLFVLHNPFFLPTVLENFMREKAASLMFLYKTKLKLSSRILDVGGGQWKMAGFAVTM